MYVRLHAQHDCCRQADNNGFDPAEHCKYRQTTPLMQVADRNSHLVGNQPSDGAALWHLIRIILTSLAKSGHIREGFRYPISLTRFFFNRASSQGSGNRLEASLARKSKKNEDLTSCTMRVFGL